jgi:Zn-dependent protease
MSVAAPDAKTTCGGCGTEVAATLLSCPVCHRLVHGETLKALAARAEAAARNGELREALVAWRSSLELLPPGSRQHAAIAQRVEDLSKQVEAAGATAAPALPESGRWKWLAALGPIGLLLWKFKFLVVAILSKGKLLLLGLTKAGTLMSMFATVGLYWTLWGLWFAVGLVISIYIHEMGHVAALRRFGIAASAPMFIPGLGAVVRLKQSPVGPREDARIGMAGPVWGLGAAVAAWTIGVLGGGPMYNAIAHTGAWINMFNLMPIWQLDGSRAFASLTRPHRWIAVAALAVAWAITQDGIVLLVLLVALARSLAPTDNIKPDAGALTLFVVVALALAVVFRYTPAMSSAEAGQHTAQSFFACSLRCDAFSR